MMGQNLPIDSAIGGTVTIPMAIVAVIVWVALLYFTRNDGKSQIARLAADPERKIED